MAKMIFEDSMKQLEKIVEELESGDLTLDKALKKFEEGVKLSKFCLDKLEETEKKITMLIKNPEGNLQETPFNSSKNDPEEE
jgi:exodeoxyribonuclease VII small subunit